MMFVWSAGKCPSLELTRTINGGLGFWIYFNHLDPKSMLFLIETYKFQWYLWSIQKDLAL